jgi:hypothetical protein
MAVEKVPIVEARTFKLGTRRDGVLVAWPQCNLVAGEQVDIWVDPTDFTGGQWLDSISEIVVDNEQAVSVVEADTTREMAAFSLDLSGAAGGERVIMGFTLNLPGAPKVIGALIINITAPALVFEGS